MKEKLFTKPLHNLKLIKVTFQVILHFMTNLRLHDIKIHVINIYLFLEETNIQNKKYLYLKLLIKQ